MKDLNSGGGGSRFDDGGLGDYSLPPGEKAAMDKTAGADDHELAHLFGASVENDVQYPFAEPMRPLLDLREKLAGVHSHLADQVSGLEVMYGDLSDQLYQKVKQASLDGTELGEVVQALTGVTPFPEFMKAAFQIIAPRLLQDGVFASAEAVEGSLQKTAGAAMVNTEHPMLVDFGEYCQVLSKLAELRIAKDEAAFCVGGVERIIKEAGAHPGGIYGHIGDMLKSKAAPAVGGLARKALGQNSSLATLAEKGVGNAHHIGAALLANQVLGGRPAALLNSYMPYDSQDKQVRQAYGAGALL